MFSPRPRRRRRTGLWILVGVAAVGGLALLAGAFRTETRELVSYLDEARIVAEDASQQAAGYQSLMRVELAELERAEFDVLMQTLEAAISDDRDRLEPLLVPDAAIAAADMLDLAMSSWETGLDGVQRSILAIADDPNGTEPVDSLSAALLDLQLGDLLYSRFLERANELAADLDVTIGEFGTVAFVADEPVLRNGEVIARVVRLSTILGARRDMAILQAVFEPDKTGGQTTAGADIFPATERFLFAVVIGNNGNQDEKGVVVVARFLDANGTVLASETSESIDLEAGNRATVTFAGVDVSTGMSYQLQLTIPIGTEDIDFDNNSMTIDIAIQAPG